MNNVVALADNRATHAQRQGNARIVAPPAAAGRFLRGSRHRILEVDDDRVPSGERPREPFGPVGGTKSGAVKSTYLTLRPSR